MSTKYTLQVYAKGLGEWVSFNFDNLTDANRHAKLLMWGGEKHENLKLLNSNNKTLKLKNHGVIKGWKGTVE